jgi:glycosyltransferase involved in cell wall biosynthesis
MNKKKLLVIVNGNYIFGAERVTLNILKGLKEKGHGVHCLVSGWNDGNFINHLKELDVNYTIIKLGWYYVTKFLWSLDSLLHYPKAVWQFLKTCRQFKHDFVYVTTFRHIILLYPFLRKNVIYHVHDNNGHKKQSKFFLKIADKKVLQYVAVSNYVKQDLIACKIKAEKIEVIYNGIQIQPVFAKANDGAFTIGVVGQVITTKGHDMVVEAFRMLREKGYNIRMLIVGRGNQKFIDLIKEKLKQYKLEAFVEWRNFKNTPSEIYEGIDVVVAPSTLNEAFGLMACEANMFSMPSVVSEKGGQQEIIIDGYNGFKVNPLNPATIAEKLARLYEDRTLVKTMGENGRKRVIEVFSIEKMNNDFNALLQNINTNQ